MRFVVPLVVAIISAAAGFGGGWYVFVEMGLGAPEPDAGHETDGAVADDMPARSPSAVPVFVNIGPLTIPVLASDRIDQLVTLIVAVEVDDAVTGERVRAQGPRLTDAYLTSIYGSVATGRLMEDGIVDIAAVKARLAEESRRVLGPATVRDVLVQVVNQRQM
ncbi:MAG TPA: hypothetical protein VK943_19145 [Arenibaculum sp.]|nr:hypothetical protein [Arenibaculum sp.]